MKIEVNAKSKGILQFCDNDPSKEIIKKFSWWDGKDFYAGYFHSILKNINDCVSKNETLAINFNSKKTLFQFIHFLNLKSNFVWKKDYAAIISPSNVFGNYKNIIKEAYSELTKKGRKKNRKFRFVLTTNYVQMGADFSVQNMIVELTFLMMLDQLLGRLDRWFEFNGEGRLWVYPAYTRFTDKKDVNVVDKKIKNETYYRNVMYGNDDNYQTLLKFYRGKNGCILDQNWYDQKELDEHYNMLMRFYKRPEWDYLKASGIYRKNYSKNNEYIDGMYRDIDNRKVIINNEEFHVPKYRIDKNDPSKLNIQYHPDLGP